MAALDFTYEVTLSVGGPDTVCQFVAPTNQRVLLKAIELMPLGSSGATVPLEFDLELQSGSGVGGTDDSVNLKSQPPDPSEAIQTTVLKGGFSNPPPAVRSIHSFSLHQQGARTWVPPTGPIVIEGAKRLGLRYLTSTNVNCKYRVHLEE